MPHSTPHHEFFPTLHHEKGDPWL